MSDLDQFTEINGDRAVRVSAKIAQKNAENVFLELDTNGNLKVIDSNSADIKALLTAIKDTDGIKKIVDNITEENSADIKTAVEAIQNSNDGIIRDSINARTATPITILVSVRACGTGSDIILF